MRVLLIYFATFDLAPKDRETMMKSIQKDSYRNVLHNIEKLDPAIGQAKKFARRSPMMTNDEVNDYN